MQCSQRETNKIIKAEFYPGQIQSGIINYYETKKSNVVLSAQPLILYIH